MAAISCVEIVSGCDDFSGLGIYACIMIMKVTLEPILILYFRWLC